MVTPLPNEGGANGSALFSYTKVFQEQLPFYLSIGMTWDEFWNDDCVKAKYYREAHYLKRKMENQKLWMLGAYFYEALCDVSPILQAFAKNGTKPLPYCDSPFPLDERERIEREKEKEKREMEKMQRKLQAWASNVNFHMKEVAKDGRDGQNSDCIRVQG